MKFKKNSKLILMSFLVLTLFSSTSCFRFALHESLPIVGLDPNGDVKKYNLGGNFRLHRYGELLNSIKEDSITKLNNYPVRENSPWELRRIYVGLGVGAEFDIGIVGMELNSLVELRLERMN